MNTNSRTELQSDLIECLMDNMDFKTMAQVLYEYMDAAYNEYSDQDIFEEIEEHFPHLLEGCPDDILAHKSL